MSFSIDLEGRRAIVTGAGQGVGHAIALTLAQAGAHVGVNDIVPAMANGVVDEITAAGGQASAAPFDVTDFAQVAEGIERFGDVDILVNNAGNAGAEGFAERCDFTDSDPADWCRYFAVNLFGTMHCTRAAVPSMIPRGWGRVGTIVSDASRD